MRNRIYSQWSQQFLVKKGDQSYVRTTMIQEEQQFYLKPKVTGMLITVLAAQKGKQVKQIMRVFIVIIKIIVLRERSWCLEASDQNDSETVEKQKRNWWGSLIAYSLIEAAKQWPDKAQEYEGQAKKILDDILQFNYNEETGV